MSPSQWRENRGNAWGLSGGKGIRIIIGTHLKGFDCYSSLTSIFSVRVGLCDKPPEGDEEFLLPFCSQKGRPRSGEEQQGFVR